MSPTGAEAWIQWARTTIRELRAQPGSTTLADQVLDDLAVYLDAWAGVDCAGDISRWQVDVYVDELEYLTNALYNLDLHLADQARQAPHRAAPAEARAFHLMLVQALLFALAQESPSRAAFVEQLRPSWPEAVQAR